MFKEVNLKNYEKIENHMNRAWTRKAFGELAEFRNGLNFSNGSCGSTIRLLGVGDFGDRFRLDPDKLPYVTIDQELEPSQMLKDGDIVFVRSNGNRALIGRAMLIQDIREPVSHSGFTIRARLKSNDALPEFAALFFHSSEARMQFLKLGGGTNISNLSQEILSCIKMPIPSKEEQASICKIINLCERSILIVESLLLNHYRKKCGLTQQLLTGRKRFKEFRDERWKVFKLGELFTERIEIEREDLPLVSITNQHGVVPRNSISKRDTSSDDKSKYLRITPGDIGYNTMRMWQGVSGLSKIEGIVSPAYTICIPSNLIDGLFASYLFKYPPVINLFRRYSQGLVDDTLALKFPSFSKIHVTIPSIKEQHHISDILQTCDREIELLEKQLEALKEQKHGLMQKLLTGEVRVKV